MSRGADLRRADDHAREAAQTVFDRPLVLTAGAGTGKTSALVARIVAWCTGPGWERAAAAVEAPDVAARVLRRVVAITFTEAAAAEMAERVGQALAGLEAGRLPEGMLETALPADPVARNARARALLECLDQLVVRTIHAWCRRLLAAYPLEAGVHPAFEIDADESVRADVVRQVLERALREEWADGSDPAFAALARVGAGPDVLERVLHQALAAGLPTDVLDEDPFTTQRVAGFRAELEAAIDAFEAVDRGRMSHAKGAKRGSDVQRALDATRRALEPLDAPESLAACAAALGEAWAGRELDTLGAWARGKLGKGEAQIVGDDAGAYPGVVDPLRAQLRRALQLDPGRLQALRIALAPLLRRARSELRARGVESYDGLLENTAWLLEQPGPRARIRAGLDQLLVDEFQDTDRTQCRVLRSLALDGDRESRPGLFLVGDPKQSIYGWRSADLAAYEDFVSRVREAGGECCELARNFRSVPAILDEVERVMRPVMRYAPGVQPEFAPLVPTLEADAEGARPAVEYWVSWDREDPADPPAPLRAAEAAASEALALASDLRRLRDEGTSLGKVGLLFRGRSDFDVYLSALRAADIPYSVEGDRGFYRRREIIEASALVRAVIDPHDALSLLTWLRSASVGVPDAALLPLWREQLPSLCADLPNERVPQVVARALERVPGGVPGIDRVRGWERSLVDALDALGALRESFATDAPDVFVEKLRARTAIEATESARFLGAYRLANLDRFFRELVARLEAGDRDPQAVLRGLRSSLRIGQEEEEGRSLAPEGDAVRVLTIHRAKGLDFEHVYLLQAHRETGGRGGDDTFGGECDGRWEYRLDGAPTLGFSRVLERRRRVAEAEQVRTLYVALTRAKRRLVVAGSWPRAGLEPQSGSYLRQLNTREGGVPELQSFVSERLQDGSSGALHAGAYWRIPALEPARPRPAPSPGSALDRGERARRDAERLAVEQAAARERMGRPLRGAASREAHEPLDELLDSRGSARRYGRSVRDVAMRAGSEIHRVLEEMDLGAEPAAELDKQRTRLRRRLADAPEVGAASQEILDVLAGGELLGRLRALRGSIVARELAFLMPPEAGGVTSAPTGCIEGVLDLVYRDAASGQWVVADYKTDAVVDERVDAYAPQLAIYARALRDGLGLDALPRAELWFLRVDRVVTLEDDTVHSAAP